VWLVGAVALGFPSVGRTAFEAKPFSAQSAALAEAMVAAPGDTYSVFYNPAGLRYAQQKSLTLGHTQLLGDADLPHSVLGLAVPTEQWGAWGLQASQFGSSLYRESELGLGFASWMGSNFSGGVGLKYQQLSMDYYGSTDGLNLDAGLMSGPWKNILAGAAVRNLALKKLGGVEESAREMQAGMSVDFFKRGFTALAANLSPKNDLTFRVGQEFWVHSVLAFRAGYETGINRVTVGVGIRQNQFSLDYAFLTQADFTEQHQMNVSYRWGNIATPEVEKPVAPRRRVEKKTAPPQPTKKAPRPAEKPAPQVEPEEKAVPEPARTPTAPSPKRRFQLN
jgi:hypothetical protein